MTDFQFNIIQENFQEIWKAIPGFPGYEVSNRGQVRSFWKDGYHAKIEDNPCKILSPSHGTGRYPHVNLCKKGKQYTRRIHRLVLEIFVGPCPFGMEACHNDGQPTNNYLTNLRWDTRKNNCHDKKIHGRDNTGSRNGQAKLTEKDIEHIVRLYNNGYSIGVIAKLFTVQSSNISQILCGKTWGHETSKHIIMSQLPSHYVNIEIDGIKYESIIDASRKLNVYRNLIYKWISKGRAKRVG